MTDRDDALVLCSSVDGLATLTLNRPAKLNAWSPPLQAELFDHLDRLADDASVRAVVVTGAGRGFCGGADMEILQSPDADAEESSRQLFKPMWFPKPIVAAINGACAGIGLQLALMCDVRIASETAKFTTAFARRGLIAEHGLTWLLPRLTSLAVAMDLLISARTFRGDEAQRLGLVHRSVPESTVLAEATAYARDLVDNVSPTAMAVIKWQLYHHHDLGLFAATDHSDQLMVESLKRSDLGEGVSSFVERRKPEFPPVDRSVVPPATGEFDPAQTAILA